MKSIKGLSMNRMLEGIKKRTTTARGSGATSPQLVDAASLSSDDPELTARNSVKAFCESGNNIQGDEVLFLPPIVDSAESSPAAAAECARLIRKYLDKEHSSRPSWQYNAIMLLRILTDNPGETFTRNLDSHFADTAKALLKSTKDRNVRQLLMETLDDFQQTKLYDINLGPLIDMWTREKDKALKTHGGQIPPVGPRPAAADEPTRQHHSQNYFAKAHSNNRLPDAVELASRLEEARTSAKLLEQVVMNTPPPDMLHNDLIKEFANRCLSASRSIQGYMTSENPSPDNDTMESLIDTNEQLQTALNQHQRAVLSAKKQLGLGDNLPETTSMSGANNNDTRLQDQQATMAPSPVLPSSSHIGDEASGSKGKGKQAGFYDASYGDPFAGASAAPSDPVPRRPVNGAASQSRHENEPWQETPGQSSSAVRSESAYVTEPYHPQPSYGPTVSDMSPFSDDREVYYQDQGNSGSSHHSRPRGSRP
ncbi:hypothetical protein CDD81_2101 [Ophiocordyceps australis]|uniref:GAT domain-containing protein n=1 Tax=Ophiocordyceps australis TaxID=1399860 RepID=A0A2C5XXM3_9HYPO|nr:hypothetical protein CDD81_2101 [Ophiocordyceps australis]